MTEAGEFDTRQWTQLNERMQQIRRVLNEADRRAAAEARAVGGAAGEPPATGGAPSSDRLFPSTAVDEALENLEQTATPIGKGLRTSNVFLDVDEPIAVSKGGAWDDPANKRFLERTTNRLTKNDLTELAPEPPPTGQISLAQAEANGPRAFKAAAEQMLIRRFSEVEELDRITREARAAMTNTTRPVGQLRSAINRAIRLRIRIAASPDAARVARALRIAGIDPDGLAALPDPADASAGAGATGTAEPPPPSQPATTGAQGSGDQPRVRVATPDPPRVRVADPDPPRVRVAVPEQEELPPESEPDPPQAGARRRLPPPGGR